jgi:hypothetical protein
LIRFRLIFDFSIKIFFNLVSEKLKSEIKWKIKLKTNENICEEGKLMKKIKENKKTNMIRCRLSWRIRRYLFYFLNIIWL